MPTGCQWPYGLVLGVPMLGAPTARDAFDKFMRGGHCAAGLVAFHPVKNATIFRVMVHDFYSAHRDATNFAMRANLTNYSRVHRAITVSD